MGSSGAKNNTDGESKRDVMLQPLKCSIGDFVNQLP